MLAAGRKPLINSHELGRSENSPGNARGDRRQQLSTVEHLLQGALETNPSAPGNATEPREILWMSLGEEGRSILKPGLAAC